ncbi:caspase recruitment domain-containing protein 8-like isoform X2 [Eublepharis macularius]|uniref:Caspase recruitment domain-containing protein 8-like isoform X2 n=1 Tax=Eublepharis macularius TaxID=481883 RepID=A0AA97L343_EUBMA|nr:caspase recruitment domain-containing protein 8-like isoform X2 [Eublepharis macularius]
MTSDLECPQVDSCDSGILTSEEQGDCDSKDEDSTQENQSGDDSSYSDPESCSESDSNTEEVDEDESNKELEDEAPGSNCAKSEVNSQHHCERCRIQQGQQEQVTPRRLSRGQFWLKLDAEGVYQCAVTGLIFEVTKAAVIKYSLLSWSKYASYIKEPWIVGGPIFDVTCTSASVLTSIQFPHTLCLNDHLSDTTFKVFHFKNNGPEFEGSADHSATHVKWQVSSLSPVGPVLQNHDPVYYHGVILLYKIVNDHPSLSFRVYVASNNDSFIKDVSKAVKLSGKKFIKIEKPPCQKLLQSGKKYRLISEPEAEITPEEIEFVDDSLLKVKSYIEVYLEQPMEFSLSLVELESQEIVWKAKLRECDWIQHNQNDNEQRRRTGSIRRRKSSNSLSEDEFCNKRLKDGTKANTVLTDKQLMILAKKMGKDWKVIGIQCLNLSIEDIEQIEAKEEDINMYKCRMLRKWRDSEQNKGTAQSLYGCLNGQASHEVIEILQEFLKQTQAHEETV